MRRATAVAGALIAVAAALSLCSMAVAAAPAGEHDWGRRMADAKRFAASRAGKVSIGVVDEDRHFHGYRANRQYSSASTIKVMLMVAYMRHGDQNHEALTASDKALLEPMIIRSDNSSATRIRDIVGNDALVRLANRVGMSKFAPSVSWGASQITARDMAQLMFEIERHIPKRHRNYAMKLLARIVPAQRWGIPPETPHGLQIHFKGGWFPNVGTSWTINQIAQLEAHGTRFSIAVLSRQNPSMSYGVATIRGVADRLLKKYPRLRSKG